MQPLASHIRLQQRPVLVTYEFHWHAVIFGTTVIEANCGVEAFEALKTMGSPELLATANLIDIDENSLAIRFVDLACFDAIDGDEWEDYWKHIL